MNVRLLKADEIDVRVQSISKGDKGAILLLYKDARCDMRILDETFGVDGWQRNHELIDGNLYCNVGVRFERTTGFAEWVYKQDVGTESYTQKEKGQASDAFKRACFNWGIGRELYTSPFIYVNNAGDINDGKCYTKFSVKEIGYNDNREINHLVIVDNKGNERYRHGRKRQSGQSAVPVKPAQNQSKEPTQGNQTRNTSLQCTDCSEDINQAVKEYSVKNFGKELCYNCQKNYRK